MRIKWAGSSNALPDSNLDNEKGKREADKQWSKSNNTKYCCRWQMLKIKIESKRDPRMNVDGVWARMTCDGEVRSLV